MEVKRRYRHGWIGLTIAVIGIVVIEWLNCPSVWRWTIMAPVFYSLSGFIQARHRFCYLYGWKGVFSITGRQHFGKSSNENDIRADRRKAWRLIAVIFSLSFAITWLYVVMSGK